MRVFSLILILVLGSSYENFASDGHPPTKLVSRIADADRIVARNYYLAAQGKGKGDTDFEIAVSKVRTIVGAVTSGERLSVGVGIDPIWGLRFYKGTNFLDEVTIQGKIFIYEDVQYRDGSTNVLEKIQTELNGRVKSPAGR